MTVGTSDPDGRARFVRPPNRRLGVIGLALMLACSGTTKGGEEPPSATPNSASSATTELAEESSIPLGPIAKGSQREHPAKIAWAFDAEPQKPRRIPIGQAEAEGYTVIDLSNSWTPFIFTEKTPGLDDTKPNRYRKRYVGLANNQIDSYGDKLRSHEANHLELYGIPPTLSVVKAEWERLSSDIEPCLEQHAYDPSVFTRYRGTIAYRKGGQTKSKRAAEKAGAKLFKQMRKLKLDPNNPEDLAKAATKGATKALFNKWRSFQDEVDVIKHAQIRFRCERLFNGGDGTGVFGEGVYDSATTHALANFEKKHDVMGWGHFKADNLAMLAMTPREAVHQRFLRVLEERIVSAAGIVEDGSAAAWKPKFEWTDEAGNKHQLRDLVQEFMDAAVAALDIGTVESAERQLERLASLGDGGFTNLLVAVKLPALPGYYSDNMKFETLIDRGDVWYAFPYDEYGNPIKQPRRYYPYLTLYVNYRDQKIPLVHWRTTIGSWRNEMFEGEAMLKYKNSDVGERVWKDIMAAPVWIPPVTTPAAELIKGRYRGRTFIKDVNYDEIGPGYRSAYGLVAAYHIRQIEDEEGNVIREHDNSIRTHGSVDYMSILRRFSHGCHRLYNMDAVRLFSFVLRHRDYVREGQQGVGVRRTLEFEEQEYEMKIDTRGYKYRLVEPIHVWVTKGRIKGPRKTPITEYRPKPLTPEKLLEELEGEDGMDLLRLWGGGASPASGEESTTPQPQAAPEAQ